MNNLYNLQAEQAVLGSLLLDRSEDNTTLSVALLTPQDFSSQHRIIFESVIVLHESEKPIDLVTLYADLEKRGVAEDIGGIDYLGNLVNSVPTAANAKEYISIVQTLGTKRQAILLLDEQRKQLEETSDPLEVMANIKAGAEELSGRSPSERGMIKISEVMDGHDDDLDMRSKSKGITGVPTCGDDLNKLTGGRQKQDLIIVAARPSVGKTAFMLNNSKAAASHGVTTGIFSLEMPGKKLGERLIANIGNIDGTMLRTGLLSPEKWGDYTNARLLLSGLPIVIDDTPGITIQQIAAKTKQLKKEYGEIFIQIDYLQLISSGKKFSSREQEIAYISRYLKQIARDNDCPVEVLSQLSRGVEQRQDKRPMMSDLRESGSIEQDADEIDFLYRDDYYNAETEKRNIVEIIVAKGRNTGTGLVEMAYLKNFSKFTNLARINY
ncbi:replicative DNA helicase [Paenibacillus sp. UMB7766-LJ446]|uniref:replicative DNA helicase n=1 Tax=Paenibacillus sp. UMB7766-LJ446 TaxID=3046313 RepID=UPI00254D93B3|nr:replicative DNA helicase [Paenibacillus sp. UMB7766-LJ446]MDK8188994.1 replicative DNA helicase [Paenibacillus sp. UMB7766-LJ446]